MHEVERHGRRHLDECPVAPVPVKVVRIRIAANHVQVGVAAAVVVRRGESAGELSRVLEIVERGGVAAAESRRGHTLELADLLAGLRPSKGPPRSDG